MLNLTITDPNDYPHAEEAEADEDYVPNGETPPATSKVGVAVKPVPRKTNTNIPAKAKTAPDVSSYVQVRNAKGCLIFYAASHSKENPHLVDLLGGTSCSK